MIMFERKSRKFPTLGTILCLGAFAGMASRPAPAVGQAVSFNPISVPGIDAADTTDARQNSYSWSMAWFQGKLYVGTNRDFNAIENMTLAYYYPLLAPILALAPDIYSVPDFYDFDLRGQIWQYTPQTGTWQMVYRSPTQPNPNAGESDKSIALDIGYRDMRVFVEPDGTQALYAVGCTVREFNPTLQVPRILRSTDGVNFLPVPFQFTALPGDPALRADGTINAVTFRATAAYNGRFYVTASGGLTGDGFLLESSDPASGQFRQVTPSSLHIYELSNFNNLLYIGAADPTTGYSVLRTPASGTPPYTLTPVVTGGAGRGQVMTSVVSMYPFQNRLYVGSAGWYSTPLPSCELIRINPDDSWQVVVGNPRIDPKQGLLFPISGLTDGFANPFNAHVWRMAEYNGLLYAGTNDDSWSMRGTPLAPFTSFQFGFDLFSSPDGARWTQVTRNGFGHPYDFGCRTLVPTDFGLFLGSVDYVNGTTVSLGQGASTAVGGHAALAPSSAARASRTKADPSPAQPDPGTASASAVGSDPAPLDSLSIEGLAGGRGAVLSWEPSAGPGQYQVFRSTYQSVPVGKFSGLPPLPGVGLAPQGAAGAGPQSIAIPGPESLIATTSTPYFEDQTTLPGRQYSYSIRSVDRKKKRATSSNLVMLPDPAPPITFEDARKFVDDLIARDRSRPEGVDEVIALIDRARASARAGDLSGSRAGLDALSAKLATGDPDLIPPGDARDFRRMVAALARRVGLARDGILPASALAKAGSSTP